MDTTFPSRSHLAELLEAVDAVPGIERVRFMTSHPRNMDERLIEAVARLPRVCEHIHVAIQSGDDGVLRRMRRGYTGAMCVSLVERIKATVPGVAISTDVIVGFPGETEEQFRRTLGCACRVRVRQGAHGLLFAARRHSLRHVA